MYTKIRYIALLQKKLQLNFFVVVKKLNLVWSFKWWKWPFVSCVSPAVQCSPLATWQSAQLTLLHPLQSDNTTVTFSILFILLYLFCDTYIDLETHDVELKAMLENPCLKELNPCDPQKGLSLPVWRRHKTHTLGCVEGLNGEKLRKQS